MTKEQVNIKAYKIMEEHCKKILEIIGEREKNSQKAKGFDGYGDEFEKVNK